MTGRLHRFATVHDVTEVLTSDVVTPPQRIGGGSTLALRSAMARFAAPVDHAARRAAVSTMITTLMGADVDGITTEVTELRLADTGPEVEATALARHVAVVTLANALQMVDRTDHAACAALVGDVEAVVAVLGRGAPSTSDADRAADRLLDAAARAGYEAVPVVSLLYQCCDATAALVVCTLHATAIGSERPAAVPRTIRVALEACRLGGVDVQPGDDLVVEIGRVGLEYGTGPHECPGRRIAEIISASIVAATEAAGFWVDTDLAEIDADGRPTTLIIVRSTRSVVGQANSGPVGEIV